ncbi:MAG: hypothetical protein BWX96_00626 [Bacteroidetes bacterium ADurb.Bin145]|nr:MAG: hypothetical protein BWX96_00626 [Bacteroidetes bacterium ADurb.Bin145]
MFNLLFWIFIKFFLFGIIVFFLSMGLVALFLYYIGIPIAKIGYRVEWIYTFIVHIIFIYCYGIFGAYFCELVYHYSVDHNLHKKWVFIILSLMALYLCYNETLKELRNERNKIASKMNVTWEINQRISTNVFNKELFFNLIVIAGYRTIFMSIISFILFLIFPSLVEVLYGTIPYTFAKLFY